jgi:hypothetical protein
MFIYVLVIITIILLSVKFYQLDNEIKSLKAYNLYFQNKLSKKLEVGFTWDKETIKYDKSLQRNDGIYANTVLWGIAINKICNPTLKTFLEELSKNSE